MWLAWLRIAWSTKTDNSRRGHRSPSVTFKPQMELLECRTVPSAGVLNPGFGTGGVAIPLSNLAFPPSVTQVATEQGGKILVAAVTPDASSGGTDITVEQLNKDGTPDTSFGTAGETVFNFGGGLNSLSNLVVLPDGKILVVGTTIQGTGFNVSYDFTVAQLTRNGFLDSSFGTNGQTTIGFGGNLVNAFGVEVQADGKIIVAGTLTAPDESFEDLAVACLTRNGILDSSFGTNGETTIAFSGNVQSGFIVPSTSLLLEPDGKILVAGTIISPDGLLGDWAIARLTKNGTLDAGFGTAGEAVFNFDGGFDVLSSLAVLPDGKILGAGTNFNVNSAQTDFAVARLNANGTLDSKFGTNGETAIDFKGDFDTLQSMVVLADGKILLAGSITDENTGVSDFAVAQLNRDGTLDEDFGTEGETTVDFGGGQATLASLVVQPDGKILLAGTVVNFSTGAGNFALARLDRDGSIDSGFGSDGQTTTSIGVGEDDLTSLLLLRHGKILAVGLSSGPGFTFSVALAEYTDWGR
jgi:uncharacterized delta-60 repeat protein